MAEEVTQPVIDLKDGQINFKNVDQFKKDFEQIIHRNSGYIVTAETLAGSKKARAELRSAAKESAAWRSKVKQELLKPFEEISEIAISFERQAKLSADDIDADVKVFDEAEKKSRADGLTDYINARLEDLGLETFTEINDKHLIKGNFNGTNPKKKFIDDFIEPELARLVEEKNQKIANVAAVKNYAESKGFDPEGYIHSLDFKTLAQIMGDIDGDVQRKRKREEAEKAIAEMEANQKQAQLEKSEVVGDKHIDVDTGEVIEVQQEEPKKVIDNKKDELFTKKLIVTATMDKMFELANYMKENGIQYRGE